MPLRCTALICLLFALLFMPPMCGAAGGAQHTSALPAGPDANVYSDVSSFGAELQRLGNAIETEKANPPGLGAIGKSLPSHWKVTAGEQHFSFSAEPLSDLLREAERARDAKSIDAKATVAADWAFDLARQVDAYGRGQNEVYASAQGTLEQILRRREFGGVKGPSALDLLKQRVVGWILELLSGIFHQIGRYPMGATIFFWLLIVAVVLWLGLILFRFWTRRAGLEELQAPDSVAFVRTWQEWIQAAREAAKRGDYREAVHSSYWAGISYLEDSEVVRKDRTRTPREYMRLVSNSTQLVATGRKTREALSALTVVLEQVWYGRRPASNQDFANALQSVEALGCQLQ